MRRPACSLLALASLATFATTACEEAPQHKAERTLTATVTLSLEDTLAIDSAVTLTIEGEKRIDHIYATLEAVVTASTSTRAEMIASRIAIEVQRRENTVAINIPILADAVLQGSLKLRVPSDLKISAIERGDTTDITGMEESISVSSQSHVRIAGAQREVTVGVAKGNAIVSADLDPGSSIEISANAGDVELAVPAALSATVEALVKTNGTIITNHPQLPPFRGKPGQIYQVRIGDGLSAVALVTGVGNIVIKIK